MPSNLSTVVTQICGNMLITNSLDHYMLLKVLRWWVYTNRIVSPQTPYPNPSQDCTRMLYLVPQFMYTVMQSGPDHWSTKPHVAFTVHGEIGVRLLDLYQYAQDRMIDPDGEVWLGDKSKITHRIRVCASSIAVLRRRS